MKKDFEEELNEMLNFYFEEKLGMELYWEKIKQYLINERKEESKFGLHQHKQFEIVFVFNNEGELQINNTISKIKRNDLIIIPPNTKHKLNLKNGYKILVSKKEITKILKNQANLPLKGLCYFKENLVNNHFIFENDEEKSKELLVLFHSFYHFKLLNLDSEISKKYLLLNFLEILESKESVHIERIKTEEKNQKLSIQIIHYLEAPHFMISEEGIAEKIFYSKRYTRKIINELFHTSFKKLLIKLKMDIAHYLLQFLCLKIKDIAHYIGYKCVSLFMKAYTNYYHESPRDYRHKFGYN